MGRYRLKCLGCGQVREDTYLLECCSNALLTTEYEKTVLQPRPLPGIWRYLDWLPVENAGDSPGGAITYKSTGFGPSLGLDNLWISFNGYWPEREAYCPTCSFKELEAIPTLQRLKEKGKKGVVVATAGNTGRAFAYYAGIFHFPVLVLVAEQHLSRIWFPEGYSSPEAIIVGLRNADYGDATALSSEVASHIGFEVEGGMKNISRRDGIGTVMVDATWQIGSLPDHYIQSIGGGIGAVACWEAVGRLLASGSFGNKIPRFHLGQNSGYKPVHLAWIAGRRELVPEDFPQNPDKIEVYTDILVNRKPTYSAIGGIYDSLRGTKGMTYSIAENEAEKVKTLFEKNEGIDIMRPAAVGVATLLNAIEEGNIHPRDTILLNISGGGEKRLAREKRLVPKKPQMLIDKTEAPNKIATMMKELGYVR